MSLCTVATGSRLEEVRTIFIARSSYCMDRIGIRTAEFESTMLLLWSGTLSPLMSCYFYHLTKSRLNLTWRKRHRRKNSSLQPHCLVPESHLHESSLATTSFRTIDHSVYTTANTRPPFTTTACCACQIHRIHRARLSVSTSCRPTLSIHRSTLGSAR